MKKAASLILLVVLTTNCISYKVNLAFGLMGIYNEKAEISKLTNNNKEVLCIPMHHIGTKSFYTDVTKKIDSLENLGFYFYTEKVTRSKNDTMALLKLRKLTGIPFSKKSSGYMVMFDSMYDGKIKYKKELIDQPTYRALGVDSLKGRNVDVTINDMIHYYETKYGELKLEKCDYETAVDKKSDCKGKPIKAKQKDDAIINFRNKHVINELLKDKHSKIAIIYGAAHFIGIKEELLKIGYK